MGKRNAEEFLAHYGVKGMKWGKRKAEGSSSLSDRLRGGPKETPSDDAARATDLRRRATRSGSDALSTRELQDLVTRMNLEQQYSRLNPKQKSAGLEFVKKIASQAAQREVQAVLTGGKGPIYKAVELALKK